MRTFISECKCQECKINELIEITHSFKKECELMVAEAIPALNPKKMVIQTHSFNKIKELIKKGDFI